MTKDTSLSETPTEFKENLICFLAPRSRRHRDPRPIVRASDTKSNSAGLSPGNCINGYWKR